MLARLQRVSRNFKLAAWINRSVRLTAHIRKFVVLKKQPIYLIGQKYIPEVLDYTFDFTQRLMPNEIIASVEVMGVPLTISNITNSNSTIKFFVSGGLSYQTVDILIKIVTNLGRTETVSAHLKIAG